MIDATPALRALARRRARQLAAQDAQTVQRDVLRRLLARAADTRFGRAHAFGAIADVAGFQARVPLRRYEDFWHDFWQPGFPALTDVTWPGLVPYFALSSGTSTGATKHIPVTRPMLRANNRAGIELLIHHALNRPDSRILGGACFMLGGSTALTPLAPGVMAGDLSGIAAREAPVWARPRVFPPAELALIADWEEKIARLAPRSLAAGVRLIGGTPSWLLLFLERLASLRPGSRRLADWYPDLELVVHGGVGFEPYRRRYEALLEGGRAELREVYPASEGFIAVADREPGEGLRLLLDNGLFYEFVPTAELGTPAPTRHWIADAVPGVEYALVVSSCAGLWAYVLGDTVRLVGRDPPRLLVAGRLSYDLSAFGEHLTGEELESAVAAAAEGLGRGVTDFAAGAVFDEGGARGRHLFVVEFRGGPPGEAAVGAFAAALDRLLAAGNADYRDHRARDFQLQPPGILVMGEGGFAAWMKSRGRLGGQNKVPRVVTQPALFEGLQAFARSFGQSGLPGPPGS